MKKISSKDNPGFRYLMSLTKPHQARRQQRVLAEGLRLCRDIAMSGISIEQLIVSEQGLAQPDIKNFIISLPGMTGRAMPEITEVSDLLMKRLCQTINNQGIALVCTSPLIEKPQGSPPVNGLFIIADQIQDPGNLGSLIRSADAFGLSGLILTEGTVWPLNDKVMRASMGSVFHLPIYAFQNIKDVADWLAKSSIPVIAADLEGDNLLETGLTSPAAVLISNEAKGLSCQAREITDRLIHIPMPGQAESLNAAAAGAIIAYEMMRAGRGTDK